MYFNLNEIFLSAYNITLNIIILISVGRNYSIECKFALSYQLNNPLKYVLSFSFVGCKHSPTGTFAYIGQ